MMFIHLALIYGESLMVTLHAWVLLGGTIGASPLPSAEAILGQHWSMTYAYLISDMTLPIIVAASACLQAGRNRISAQIMLVLAVHTASYLLFMWNGSSLEPVTEWAYSDWPQRILIHKDGGFLSLLPVFAVLIDLISHAWGLHNSFLLRVGQVSQLAVTKGKFPVDKNLKQLAAALGVVVAAASMKMYAK